MGKSLQEKTLSLNHERLTMMGTSGTIQRSLLGVDSKLEQGLKGFRVAPPQKQENRNFVDALGFVPPVDITLARYSGGRASIVGYSLDKSSLEIGMNKVAKIVGFRADSLPDPSLRSQMTSEFGYEIVGYQMVEQMAPHLRASLERVWGMVRYTNFLSQYLLMPEEEAIEKAKAKFGISF